MSTQEHTQKQPTEVASVTQLHNGFATRGFAEQTESDKASNQQPQDLKTQLSRAFIVTGV